MRLVARQLIVCMRLNKKGSVDSDTATELFKYTQGSNCTSGMMIHLTLRWEQFGTNLNRFKTPLHGKLFSTRSSTCENRLFKIKTFYPIHLFVTRNWDNFWNDVIRAVKITKK